MNPPFSYIPSQTQAGDFQLLREHSFTLWMSHDLLQAATDFCHNLGLVSIYSECAPDHRTRYLFWHPPQGARFELRTGRTEEQFREYDRANVARDWPLLSLHISDRGLHSATWISPAHYDTAVAVLALHGITPAERKPAG